MASALSRLVFHATSQVDLEFLGISYVWLVYEGGRYTQDKTEPLQEALGARSFTDRAD
jgi:hypothetical protein